MQQQSSSSSTSSSASKTSQQMQPRHLAMVAPAGEQVHVHLSNAATWQKFSRQNTEMIVTKAGRRMFPSLSLDIAGLDPAKKYEIYVTLLLAEQHTLKYQRGLWIVNGQAEVYPPPGCTAGLAYLHPDSPATGRHWTKQEVTFMKLKLTNKLEGFADDPTRNGSMIFAYSMHKYLPVVHICELPDAKSQQLQQQQQPRFYTSVTFPGTEFITVTAYQNPELTDLKIQFNPYAKGVRNQSDRASGCGSFLIDTFRPSVLKFQPPQSQMLKSAATAEARHQPEDAAAIEFGAYPAQSASAYGHWQHSQQQQQQQQRRYQPYALQPALAATPVDAAPLSPAESTAAATAADEVTEVRQDEVQLAKPAAAAVSSSHAYYLSTPYLYHHQQQQQYHQQYQQHSSHYQQQLYYTPTPPQPQQQHSTYYYNHLLAAAQPTSHQHQVKLESTAIIEQQSQQHQQDSLLQDSRVTPPLEQQQQQQQQQPHHHHQHHHQSCSLMTQSHSSHVTDSSPSGISFNSPDV